MSIWDDVVVAVPSYRRASLAADKTLAELQRLEVPPDRITVFVADAAEADDYATAMSAAGTREGVTIEVAEPGMGAVRRFVQGWYAEGEHVLSIDDDVSTVEVKDGSKLTAVTPAGFDEIVAAGFAECQRIGVRLWGIYPVRNAYFMRDEVTHDLRYVNGTLWGFVNTHDQAYSVTLDDKEDFERTLLCYALDGAVVRFGRVCTHTRYYTEPGGMQETRTPETVEAGAADLLRRFPLLCERNTRKKSAHAEVRLRDRRPRAGELLAWRKATR